MVENGQYSSIFSYKYRRHRSYFYLLLSFRLEYISVSKSISRHLNLLSLKLRQKAFQRVSYKVVIKGKIKHIKFDNNFLFRTWHYFVINIYSKNIKIFQKKKKNYKKKVTDIEEDCSVCDELSGTNCHVTVIPLGMSL